MDFCTGDNHPAREEDASGFVLLSRAVPDVILEMRYFSTYNFVGERIDGYEEPVALMTREAAAALREAGLSYVSTGEEQTVTSQLPPAGSEVYAGSQVMLYLGAGEPPETDMYVCVPDVTGMTIVNANRTLRARELNLYIEGSGLAVSQSPAAGEYVAPGEQISVVFKAP